MAVRQAALVSDERALEACSRRRAIQIDDLYLYLYLFALPFSHNKFVTDRETDGRTDDDNHANSSIGT